ncbi:MAG: FAD-binding oxidoreductase [Chitinophagaceae bacterium]
MLIDYLIIGQGISGTWLSYFLEKEEQSFLVIDDNSPGSSSKIAAGIINPVTGRRHVTAWMAEEIMPFAREAYTEIGNLLVIEAISRKDIIDFFPNPQMRLSFMQRVKEKGEYVYDPPGQDSFHDLFNYEFGCGEIKPVYTVDLETLLPAWRQHLKEKGLMLEEEFEIEQIKMTADKIHYKDITAAKIIFCDGVASANNPYFSLLPFAPNKGELLVAEIPGLASGHIYKKGIMLVPLAEPGYWWVGSSYDWDFADPGPTIEFREKTKAVLNQWLKMPFRIQDHLAGIRPATLERRPFVGFHPLYPKLGILNGMGTKGCSLAPFFAKQLADHICYGKTLNAEIDITRFQKILSRNIL